MLFGQGTFFRSRSLIRFSNFSVIIGLFSFSIYSWVNFLKCIFLESLQSLLALKIYWQKATRDTLLLSSKCICILWFYSLFVANVHEFVYFCFIFFPLSILAFFLLIVLLEQKALLWFINSTFMFAFWVINTLLIYLVLWGLSIYW